MVDALLCDVCEQYYNKGALHLYPQLMKIIGVSGLCS
jgi:hypothetical protein